MTEIRKYLDISPESKASYKIREMELNKTPLHSMMNDWSIKQYVKGFDLDAVTLKHDIDTFDRIQIAEIFMQELYLLILKSYQGRIHL